jgi:hypothetical protein
MRKKSIFVIFKRLQMNFISRECEFMELKSQGMETYFLNVFKNYNYNLDFEEIPILIVVGIAL